jgi:MFS family permease
MNQHESAHVVAGADPGSTGSNPTLTLISLAHAINHAQAALKPLVFPLVLRELNFGYSELGIMLGVASAVGGSLQLAAGALGRILPRHHILGVGNASVGACFVLVALAQSYFQFFFWTVMSRVGGAAQHPVGSSLISHHFKKKRLGVALATHFTAGNVGTAFIPLCAAIMIGLWGWRVTTILFAIPAVLVGIAMCIWLKDPAAPMVGVIFTLMSVGSIVGPMLGGKLADRYHPQRVLIICYSVSAVTAFTLPWFGANLAGVAAASFTLGVAAFGTNPILQTMVAQTSSDRIRDTGFAWFYTATFLAGAIWSPTVGYLSDWLGLKAVFGAMAASFVLAILCVLLGRLHEIAVDHEHGAAVHSHH